MHEDITIEEIMNTINRIYEWKSSGIEKLTNFLLYHLCSSHQLIMKLISETVEVSRNIWWLKRSINILSIKIKKRKQLLQNLKNYRPITCSSFWRCPWCSRYRCRKWTRRHEFKSWTRLIAFHIALILLGKVWIQLFSLQLWINSRTD